jgi:hypothetical protein
MFIFVVREGCCEFICWGEMSRRARLIPHVFISLITFKMSGNLRPPRSWPFKSDSPRSSTLSIRQPNILEGEVTPSPNSGNHDGLLSSKTHQLAEDDTARGTLPTKIKQLKWIVFFYVATAFLLVLLYMYIYEVLVSQDPHIGRLLFSPTKTLLTVSILSQSFILLLESLVSSVLDTLRWQLASGDNGIPVSTFLGLSGATSLWGVIVLMCHCGNLRWGFHRYL